MEQPPIISVIVPVYNVAEYLPKCIDSILEQSYIRTEVILVDDGSTDSSGRICDEYKSKDSRIRVIHKKNGGLSDARNAGIEVMSGEYVTFIDSDDWVHRDYVAVLYSCIREHNAQISAARHARVSNEDFVPTPDSVAGSKYISPIEAIIKILYQDRLDNSACGKLYHKSIFTTPDGTAVNRFRTGIGYEDLDLFYLLYERAERTCWLDRALYYYRIREDSYIGTFSLRRADVLDVTDRIEKYFLSLYPSDNVLCRAARNRKLSANFNILWLMSVTGENSTEIENRCWLNICQLRNGCLADKHVRLKNKIGILLSYGGRRFLREVMRRVKRQPNI